ncbi:ATP-dependent Clp protease ATP-binding subunit, partial [Candidatus Dojkabacteria bacterium]|nr:ATP-dependent Clp protease ATP-binding subunit [Candidatus Dojkabacteria bacterium]
SNFIITATENSDLSLIATTTPEGYERYIAQNDALARLFTRVEMKIPSMGDIQQIVADESVKMERASNVKIGYDAITTAIQLSEKYTTDRTMPDKALDLIRESVSYVSKQKVRVVDALVVSTIVSERIGVNVGVLTEDEKRKLMDLELEMKKRIVGQDKAIKAVARAMKAERMGIRDDSKPIASFLFAGPTGVGKTEVARTLARIWFGGEEQMTRLDMSEYQEEENIKRLIGYKTESGYYEEGYLTGAVRGRPFGLILLDEMEKANPRVLDLFLQILDEGRLKDGLNRDTNYKSCVIIATSNIGSKTIADNIEGKDFGQIEKLVKSELNDSFRIEFLNRFDDVIVFKPLSKDDIRKIAYIMLNLKAKKLKEKGYNLEITNELVNKVAEEGYSPIWGARELKRVIDNEVNNLIS